MIPLRVSSTSLDADSYILLCSLTPLLMMVAYSCYFFLLVSLAASVKEDSSCLDLHSNRMTAPVSDIGT